MEREIKKGDEVMIYDDPPIEKKPEGKAIAVRCYRENDGYYYGRKMQMWWVRFPGEDAEVLRTVIL